MSVALAPPAATLDELMRTEGKAEVIDGMVVRFMASGALPSLTAFEIAVHLRIYARSIGAGVAFADGVGYAPDPAPRTGRQTFSPDASYYPGPIPPDFMKFVAGMPALAVEVRSENDYGPAAEREIALKREQYLAAGTSVVWDVDPLARTVRVYRADGTAAEYGPTDVADAEPALPGWRVPVADLFPTVPS